MSALPWSRPLTRADLEGMPEDGHRYELLEGSLLVTPAPAPRHQVALLELASLLHAAIAGTKLLVLVAPIDVAFSDSTVLEPDVLLVRRADVGERGVEAAPLLVAEVLAPSTRSLDLGAKRLAYAAGGVPHYWVIDPYRPSLVAWRLGATGDYKEVAVVEGDEPFAAAEPVPVTVVPADLIRPLLG
jgi:Uma2 family endonuclease